jgi:DNA mismatch repair protein MutS
MVGPCLVVGRQSSVVVRKWSKIMAKMELHSWYRQYRQLKAQAPDAILFFRFGDFYETFDDDAKLIAELLDVTLTRKDYAVDKSKPKEPQKFYAPMAGMPYHAVERYVSDLVGRGYRVAIAEQLSATESSQKDTRPRSVFAGGIAPIERQREMVHREIVRIITPGTVIEPGLLTAGANNYLAAVISTGGRVGLAYADLSTGEFAATEFGGERAMQFLQSELARLNAAEVLVPDDETLRLPGLEPATARLSQDLAPMTKEEREGLLPHERVARKLDQESAARWVQGHITAVAAWRWELRTASDVLTQQLRVGNLAGFGLRERPLAAQAAGALLGYVHETQRHKAPQIASLRVYTTGSFMFLDPQTRRNLELLEGSSGKAKGALVGVLDRTRTPMGARLLRRWIAQPLLDLPALQVRQAAVAACVDDTMLRAELRESLGSVGDMERAINRIAQGTTTALPRDLVQLRAGLRALPGVLGAAGDQLTALLADEQGTGAESGTRAERNGAEPEPQKVAISGRGKPRVASDDLFDDDDPFATVEPTQTANRKPQNPTFDPCTDILALLERALDDDPPALLGASNYLRSEEGGERPRRVIRPGFAADMDKLIKANRDAQRFIDSLEERERTRTGIKSLKVSYNSVFGYFIELSRTVDQKLIPSHYERKQTLVGAERYITAELKEYEGIIEAAKLRLVELEREAFGTICAAVAAEAERLRATAQAVARLDAVASLAEAAVRGRYVRPTLDESTRLRIVAGRHPVVETVLEDAFVPNDITLDTDDEQLLIISGANMAGKSTVMRQVALIVLMAQIGSYVPADEAAIGLVDRIFTRIGAQDDIATGQSTFMVEMTETAALLVQSTRRSLIILDEVGRGTSTYDGMAIARAVVEYIHNEPRLQCRTLFATHYHELTELEQLLPRVQNYHMAASEQDGQVIFLHELRRGGADRSYGIHVAELAGIPRSVIRRAAELLAEFESAGAGSRGQEAGGRRQEAGGRRQEHEQEPTNGQLKTQNSKLTTPQLSLFDVAPNPAIEYLRRLNLNELTPLEALNKLYELQKIAKDA